MREREKMTRVGITQQQQHHNNNNNDDDFLSEKRTRARLTRRNQLQPTSLTPQSGPRSVRDMSESAASSPKEEIKKIKTNHHHIQTQLF
jgi:hypothetical protein